MLIVHLCACRLGVVNSMGVLVILRAMLPKQDRATGPHIRLCHMEVSRAPIKNAITELCANVQAKVVWYWIPWAISSTDSQFQGRWCLETPFCRSRGQDLCDRKLIQPPSCPCSWGAEWNGCWAGHHQQRWSPRPTACPAPRRS